MEQSLDSQLKSIYMKLVVDDARRKYSEDQERDEQGRFGSGGGDTTPAAEDKLSASTGAGVTAAGFTKDGAMGVVKIENDMQKMVDYQAKEGNIANNAAEMVARMDPEGGASRSGALYEQCERLGRLWLPGGEMAQRNVDMTIAGMQRAGATSDMKPEEVGARMIATVLQDSWAGSASDSNPESLAMHYAIADKLGLSTEALDQLAATDANNVWQSFDVDSARERLGLEQTYGGAASTADLAKELAASPGVQEFVDIVYGRTQDYLASRGITELNLFRGVKAYDTPELDVRQAIADFQKEPLGTQGVAVRDVTLNPLSSFSTSEGIAYAFAGQIPHTERNDSAVLQAVVPADHIFSYPGTGPGCLNEKEVIIAGGDARIGLVLGDNTWDPVYGPQVDGLTRPDDELAQLRANEPGHIGG